MPNLFGRSGPFDEAIDKICDIGSENDDWQLIMNLCDQVNTTPNGHRIMAKGVIKKIRNCQRQQLLHAVTLLDACVNNCDKPFHLQLCTRENINDLKQFILKSQASPALQDGIRALKECMVKWAKAFGEVPQLYLMNVTIVQLKGEGVSFPTDITDNAPPVNMPSPSPNSSRQDVTEEEMIKKAIELSLKETQNKGNSGSIQASGNQPSIYPTFTADKPLSTDKELFKVRALYDFEAAEENEITFKTDDIISVTDNTDQNWWKGRTPKSSGLFPANFVTRQLEVPAAAASSVTADKPPQQVRKVTEINAEQIDLLLEMLKKADATVTNEEEDKFIKELEIQVNQQESLITVEYNDLKSKHEYLDSVNDDMSRVIGLYHKLLKEAPPVVTMPAMPPIQYSYQPQNMNPSAQFPQQQVRSYGPPPNSGYHQQFANAYNNPAPEVQQGAPNSPPPSYNAPTVPSQATQAVPTAGQVNAGVPAQPQPAVGVPNGALPHNHYQGPPISHVVPIYTQPMQYTHPNIAHVSPMSQNNGSGGIQ